MSFVLAVRLAGRQDPRPARAAGDSLAGDGPGGRGIAPARDIALGAPRPRSGEGPRHPNGHANGAAPEPSPPPGLEAERARELEDRRLLDRVAGADEAALRTLYERFGGRTFAVAIRILGVEGEAEEVVQEAFVEVWRRASQYDALRGGVSSWVLAIARNRAIDRLRARTASDRAIAEVGRAALVRATSSESPLETLEARRARERVCQALDELPDEQRTVLELAYFEGLTQTEIAARLQSPLGTVKTRAKRGLERLERLLEPPAASGDDPEEAP